MMTTTTTEKVPWDNIQVPTADFNVRLVESSTVVPLYWGKNIDGNCLLIVELCGDHSRQFQKNRINVRGISVDLQFGSSTDKQNIVLILEEYINRDLFLGLCTTLISSLENVSDSGSAVAVVFQHLGRWKNFLAGKNARILTSEEIRGLFCELHFLRTLYQDHLNDEDAVNAWCGPEGMHQDFVLGNTSVEIKSLSGTERNTVRISSEDQLESIVDNLFLKTYRTSISPEAPYAKSLNEFVRIIQSELEEQVAVEIFNMKLASFGYVELNDYDNPRILVIGEKSYRVTDEFPRITRSNIALGLTRVRYQIMLEHIERFKCGENELWEGI